MARECFSTTNNGKQKEKNFKVSQSRFAKLCSKSNAQYDEEFHTYLCEEGTFEEKINVIAKFRSKIE